jgi:mRNA deadenylase 3'-5' endonuclease subunit Ccr4
VIVIGEHGEGKVAEDVLQLKMLQFNCLADALSDGFTHADDPKVFTWEHRWPLIQKILLGADYDFIGLQEVDHYYTHFMPFLAKYGYQGVFLMRRMDEAPISKDGVALFWKNDRFRALQDPFLFDSPGTNKTFGLALNFFTKNRYRVRFTVAVLHLSSKDAGAEQRIAEINRFKTEINCISQHFDEACFVLGDFNDVPYSPVYDIMCQDRFLSAYEPDQPRTTWKTRRATGEVRRTIDYIWYKIGGWSASITVDSTPSRELEAPAPNQTHPSDHLPLEATFSIIQKF